MNCELCLPWFELPDRAMRKTDAPSLDCLIRYAKQTDKACLPELVSTKLPFASLQRLALGLSNDRAWLCATPINLQIGIEKIIAYPVQNPLGQAEAEALISYLNEYFSQDEITFEYVDEQHWFLSYPKSKMPVTTPAQQIMGKSIYPLLPEGEHEAFWHRFINELQMLLHQAPVNQKREDLGVERISVFWPWGEGELKASGAVPDVQVVADDLHGIGLARMLGVDLLPLDQFSSDLFQSDEERVIVYSDSGNDPGEDIHYLESRIFSPLLSAWKKGELKNLSLILGGESFELGPRRFWQALSRC